MASTETVTVACKLPHGLRLRVFKKETQSQAVMGGGARDVDTFVEIPEATFVVFGNAHPQNAAPKCLLVGDFALTPNVPKDLWDAWLAQNKDSDVVKNGLIFAHARDQGASAAAESKEKAALRSGLERLDPSRLPKGVEVVKRPATV